MLLGAGKLEHHPAGELFAFTKKWWREHQSKVPDFILGKDHYFLRAFLEFMRQNGAKELPFTTYTQPKTIVPQGSKEVPKRVAYNEGLAAKYMKSVNYPPMYPKVSEQLKLEPLNRIALKPFGYNPSIARIGGRMFMAYRWHEEDTPATSIVMAQIDDHWNPLETVEIRVPKGGGIQSIDDPRLFVYEGELHISYVASTWPDKTPKSTVHYARLARDGQFWTLIDSTRIDYGKNDGTAMEKNWIFFERDQKLFCIYHNDPQQVVLQVVGDQVITEHKSPTPHWPWGKIHGGTVPMPYKDKLLRFFHTRLDNEPAPTRWRYYMGACLMNPEPPFEIVQVCREPIARGSEADDLTDLQRSSCIHHKKSVVFPGGCVQDGNDFLVSIGINDCECAVARIAESDLKL